MNTANGKVIIATPKITGAWRNTVIYVYTSDSSGAVGAMLNVPMDERTAVYWSKELNWSYPDLIRIGGPLEQRLGYMIHTNDYSQFNSVVLNEHLTYTTGSSILNDINRGVGPNRFMLVTGYCAWYPGQLENEINSGKWYVDDFHPDYIFQELDREEYWKYAIELFAKNQTRKLLDAVDMP